MNDHPKRRDHPTCVCQRVIFKVLCAAARQEQSHRRACSPTSTSHQLVAHTNDMAHARFISMVLCLWQLFAGDDVLGEILPIPVPGRGKNRATCRPSEHVRNDTSYKARADVAGSTFSIQALVGTALRSCGQTVDPCTEAFPRVDANIQDICGNKVVSCC